MPEYTNSLIHSTSPYLLQHAHNPVHWQEWGNEVLEQAVKEDKPILVSIGYSSCHWCHVMEKESFEDLAVARLMNKYFINIKVDREERPDVDQIYMEAIQFMGLSGGWPLNVFLTSDQKPFYGGTYFPNKGWQQLLQQVADAYANNRAKINESAEGIVKSLQVRINEKYKPEEREFKLDHLDREFTFRSLAKKFDTAHGGIKKAPKFPMPSVWQYLALHAYQTKSKVAMEHLEFTLERIADGGIYDHVGGGFARYSVDEEWHVPHFEKMLYDNGQLLSLYANGYKISKNEKFRNTILETIEFLQREMLDASGGFYAALDADSEGEEGKFYVWDEQELRSLAGDSFGWISKYYDINPTGNWEGKTVLRVVEREETLLEKFELTKEKFRNEIRSFKAQALEARTKRVRPGLDYKIIAGWNGLALSGLCDAYQALGDSKILQLAKQNAEFIRSSLIETGKLKRFPTKDMEGFLEDYAAVIQSFIKYYETTSEQEYLNLATALATRVDHLFYDEKENLYHFTSDDSEILIARKKELFDNVIPASNSIMTWNLIHLGTHLYREQMVAKGKSILAQVSELLKQEPEYMSNWTLSALELSSPFAEIVIVGLDAHKFRDEINRHYIPNKIIATSEDKSKAQIFEFKEPIDNQTTIFVCFDKVCKSPVTTVAEALRQLHDSH